jgi:hypothetical protein
MDRRRLCFVELLNAHSWKEIRHCPGRYILTKQDNQQLRTVTPHAFLDEQVPIESFTSEICRDRVLIGKLVDGALLSYEKSDGTFIHTLNNLSGLQRKMNHLNIRFSDQTEHE